MDGLYPSYTWVPNFAATIANIALFFLGKTLTKKVVRARTRTQTFHSVRNQLTTEPTKAFLLKHDQIMEAPGGSLLDLALGPTLCRIFIYLMPSLSTILVACDLY